MSAIASMMPQAFVGYAIAKSGLMIRCCAYCPDKTEMDEWAARKGTPVTHTICPACYQKQIAELTGEQL